MIILATPEPRRISDSVMIVSGSRTKNQQLDEFCLLKEV